MSYLPNTGRSWLLATAVVLGVTLTSGTASADAAPNRPDPPIVTSTPGDNSLECLLNGRID